MEEEVLKRLEFEAIKFKHANKLTDRETACFVDGYRKTLEILLEMQGVKINCDLDDVIKCKCLSLKLFKEKDEIIRCTNCRKIHKSFL